MDLRKAVGAGKRWLVVATDGQRDQVARTEPAAARGKHGDLLGEARQSGNHVGIAGLGAANGVIGEGRQIVDRLQRVDEVGALAEMTGWIGRWAGGTGKAQQAECAAGRRTGVGVAVAKTGN